MLYVESYIFLKAYNGKRFEQTYRKVFLSNLLLHRLLIIYSYDFKFSIKRLRTSCVSFEYCGVGS